VKKAKDRLAEMEMPIPEADKAAMDRANYNKENYKKPGLLSRSMNLMFSSRPDTTHASKIGDPTMTSPKATIPVSVPVVAEAAVEGSGTGTDAAGTPAAGNNDVSIKQISGPSKLDTGTDPRTGATTPETKPAKPAAGAGPLPTNRDAEIAKMRAEQQKKAKKLASKKKKKQDTNQGQPAATPAPAPAAGQPPPQPAAAVSQSNTPAPQQ
jgi:hypothetical protein